MNVSRSAGVVGASIDSTAVQGEAPRAAKANPQMQAVLDQLATLGATSVEGLTPHEVRQQPSPADAVKALLEAQGRSTAPEAVSTVDNMTVPGPDGPVAIRVYTPAGTGPFPVILYIHGGGWVLADLDTYDASPRALANAAQAVVVSTHYRQAPEHPFPAAHDDTWAAYAWVLAHAASINGDPRTVALAGESVGGNMAAAISMTARDRGLQMPVHQLLVYPVANHAFDTPSYREHANASPLGRAGMQWFFRHYLTRPTDGDDPRVSILRAATVTGLPSTTVITAEIDPLRSEGEMYVKRLQNAGVDVWHYNYDGVTHEFFGMGAVVDKAREAVRIAALRLNAAFGDASRTQPPPATGDGMSVVR